MGYPQNYLDYFHELQIYPVRRRILKIILRTGLNFLKNPDWIVCIIFGVALSMTVILTVFFPPLLFSGWILRRESLCFNEPLGHITVYTDAMYFFLLCVIILFSTYSVFCRYGVATISRLLKIIGLFCKRALWNRRYSAKETYDFKEPTHRSHPIVCFRELMVHTCV